MKKIVFGILALLVFVANVFFSSATSFAESPDKNSAALDFDSSDNVYSVSVFSPSSVFRDELVGGTDIVFSVFKNGVKLSSDEASRLDLSVSADGLPFVSEVLSDGTVRVRVYGLTDSSFFAGLLRPLSPYLLKTGDVRVRLAFRSDEDNALVGNTATVCVLPEPFGRYVFYIFLPFLILFVALGYVFKSRFKKNVRLVAFDVTETDGKLGFERKETKNPSKISFRSFVPYIRNKATVGGVKVSALGVFRKRFYIRSTKKLLSFAVINAFEPENGAELPKASEKRSKKSHIIFSSGEAVLLKTTSGFVCIAAESSPKSERRDKLSEKSRQGHENSEITAKSEDGNI